MKKTLFATLLFAAFFCLTSAAQEMALDSVLAHYFRTTGMDKIHAWNSMVVTAKSVVQGTEYPVVITYKKTNKIRMEVTIQAVKMITAFDGEKGWSIVPWTGSTDPQDMTEDQVKSMKEQASIESQLYNWKEKGHKVELLGKEDMDGSPAYKIKLTHANGNTETFFIDAENFVILKVKSVSKVQGNDVEGEMILSNFKEVNGTLQPFTMENKSNGQTVASVVIDKYEIDVPVDDAIFVKPVKK
jgi:hypothetical protein